MNHMVKEWLKQLYTEAIVEAKSAIANERIWQNGADSDDEIAMREGNLENLEEYIEVLQEKISEL